MLKIKMTVSTTRKYDYEGKKYVEITGVLAGLGLFKMSVNEKLVPDDLEGHEVIAVWSIGIDRKSFKPYFRFSAIAFFMASRP